MKSLLLLGAIALSSSTAVASIKDCGRLDLQVQLLDLNTGKVAPNPMYFGGKLTFSKHGKANRYGLVDFKTESFSWEVDSKDGFYMPSKDLGYLLEDRIPTLTKKEVNSIEKFIKMSSGDEIDLEPNEAGTRKQYSGVETVSIGGYDDTAYDALRITFTYAKCKTKK